MSTATTATAKPRRRVDAERVLLGLAAPVLAVVISVAICSVMLASYGKDPVQAFQTMWNYGTASDGQIATLNKTTTYYIAGIAVAFGFRMNMFNIGAEGQYRLAALFAAFVGGQVDLPSYLEIPLVLIVAMLVGGMWASVAAVLKVYRGVSEVVSTIMLNFIANSVIGMLLVPGIFAPKVSGTSNSVQTKTMAPSSDFFFFNTSGGQLYGFIIIAALLGVLFHLTLSRTRFGFDLRATGRSETAALASGVNVKRMMLTSLMISGALAGLIGMPDLLQNIHYYGQSFQPNLGFTGIAIALLGRNTPIGIAIAAVLWGFLDATAVKLPLAGFPQEIVAVMQGIIVISVVVAYELVRRYGLKRQQQKVGAQLAAQAGAAAKKEAAA